MCRRRPVIKDMPEMRPAPGADHLRTRHIRRFIRPVYDAIFPERLKKTGPAAGAGKLGIRPEQPVPAHRTVIRSFCFVVEVFTRKRLFGCLLPRDRIQLRRKDLLPLRIAYVEPAGIGRRIIRVVLMGIVRLKVLRKYTREERQHDNYQYKYSLHIIAV